jgi:excisionase family DNA binding protein
MPKLDQFLRIQEAAEYLGVCRNTLRNWCRQARIPEYRHPINNYRLFKVGDLDRLLQKTEQAVNQEPIRQRIPKPR